MTAQRRQPLSKLLRFSISVLLVGHLLAVVLPPLSFQTRGPLGQSPSIATIFAPLERYCQFLYIDRGYAFFAPEPGPSHLIQAAVTDSKGERIESMFPDLQQQWPRLLYHRHFMLAEFLNEIYQPPGPPPELVELDPEEAEFWIRSRARYEHFRQSIVEHLQHENPGKEVAIRRIEHLIPDLIQYQEQPIALDDPELYRVMLDERPAVLDMSGDLAAPVGPPETVPPPTGTAVERAADPGDESSSEDPKQEEPVEESKESDSSKTPAAESSETTSKVDKEAPSKTTEVGEETKPDEAAAAEKQDQPTAGDQQGKGDDAESEASDKPADSESLVDEGVAP